MNEREVTQWLSAFIGLYGEKLPQVKTACEYAIKAIGKQIKVKEYIERINQPEYQDIRWTKEEIIVMLQELLVEGGMNNGRCKVDKDNNGYIR